MNRDQQGTWRVEGFHAFRQGIFGNGGQNLYVSRGGVLQRIHQYDFNGDGHLDLLFCNSQNHLERVPASVYTAPMAGVPPYELPAEGAWSGAVADLNGDGYEDLVIANWYNGIRKDLNASVYYGGADGYSENRQLQLPAPRSTSVAIADFDGDGRPDLAFVCDGRLRIFYQNDLGFEPKRFVDLDVAGQQIAAADLDGDGFADLVLRDAQGRMQVLWGGREGLDAQRHMSLPDDLIPTAPQSEEDDEPRYAEYVEDAHVLARILVLDGVSHLFVSGREAALLVPVDKDRQFGAPLRFDCGQAISAATGDVRGNGHTDLVFACRQPGTGEERSWVYWGGPDGFRQERCTPLPSHRAADVAVADLDGDGCDEIVLCQSATAESYTSSSLIYRGGAAGIEVEPIPLVSHDARRVLVARGSDADLPQLVFVNYYGRNRLGNIEPVLYLGGEDGFRPERHWKLPGWGAVEAVGCDVNDDGRPDLVLANASENSVHRDPGSYLLLNGPHGFPLEPSQILPTARAHGVCCADLNRNGYLDLVFCGFDNPEILIFYGGPQGFDIENPERIQLEYEGVTYRESRWIYLADLTGDGWLDLIVPQISYDRSLILWGGPEGFSMERCQALSVVRGACARAADLTGNGSLDLIIGGHMPDLDAPHDSFVYIYWNGPHGIRSDHRTQLPAKTINSMAVADFNRDGMLDLFICSYHGGTERDVDSYIYWNRPGRGFSAADRTRLFTHSASGCVAADFDGDGWIDLAVANHKVDGDHLGESAVWWNGPDGFDEGRTTRLPTSGPHGMMAVEPGNVADRGPLETYISAPFQLPSGARPQRLTWQAKTSATTWVQAQVRQAPTEADLEQVEWTGPDGADSWYSEESDLVGSSQGGWCQFRLALGATNGCGTPRVTAVALDYGP